MNIITVKQRIKLYCQQTFGGLKIFVLLAVILYAFICFDMIEIFKFEFDFIKFLTIFLLTLFGLMVLSIIINFNNLTYLFYKNIYVVTGNIIKYYHDRNHGTRDHERFNYFSVKKINIFSGNIKKVRKEAGYSTYRAKAQSLDKKYTTSWISIPKNVAKKMDNYSANIIIYKNEAITFLYEKKLNN